MNELERGNDDNARYFLSGTFAVLRQDLGIDGLLLTQVRNREWQRHGTSQTSIAGIRRLVLMLLMSIHGKAHDLT